MLKQHPTLLKQAIALSDAALISTAFAAAYGIVSRLVSVAPMSFYWLSYAAFILPYVYFAWSNGLFSVLDTGWDRGLLRRFGIVFVTAGVVGAAALYLMPDDYRGRRLYYAFMGISLLLLTIEKVGLRRLLQWLHRRDRNTTSVLLFGRGRLLSQVAKEFETHPQWGYRLRLRMDLSATPHDLERILTTAHIEEVMFCIPHGISRSGFSVDPYLRVCEQMGRPARVFLNLGEATSLARWQYQPYLELRTMVSHTAELDPDQLLLKRILDIAGGLVGVALLALTWPFIALAIKTSSPGPVFFSQQRVGRNGRRFAIYKYRSMVIDAEQRKEALLEQNELSGAVFKIKHDPRVTPVGRILRKYSLDEWPQFLNVLRGDMSLVGTRPPTPDEVEQYESWHHRRISIKPGLTGLWQVSGRNRITDFDEIVRLDLKYIDNWSIALDLRIILKTVMAVFKRGEAY